MQEMLQTDRESKDGGNAWAEVDNPELWRHLLARRCASCDERHEFTQEEYKRAGNFCAECMSEVNKAKVDPEIEKMITKALSYKNYPGAKVPKL